MKEVSQWLRRWLRNGLVIVGMFALAYWLGAIRPNKSPVYAASESDPQFQLTGVNQTSALLIYEHETKTIYVYQGATTGNSYVQCSFKFQLGKPGSAIQRVPCS